MFSIYPSLHLAFFLTCLSFHLFPSIHAHTSHASSFPPSFVQPVSPFLSPAPALTQPSSLTSASPSRVGTRSSLPIKSHVPLAPKKTAPSRAPPTPPPPTASVHIDLKNAKVDLSVKFDQTAWGVIISIGPNPRGLLPGSPYGLEIHSQGISPSAPRGQECQSTGQVLGTPLGQVKPDVACSPKSPQSCPSGNLAGMFGPLIGQRPPPRMIHSSLSLTDLQDRSLLLIDPSGQAIACCNFARHPSAPPLPPPPPPRQNATIRVVKRKPRPTHPPLPSPSSPQSPPSSASMLIIVWAVMIMSIAQ
ncbi:MAG: hypothetical protein DHS80DRAFT_23240 [Piptocephalis tieghemiana]|nr:MAG: hypothetical protein DHS80DRAFT_23240 [Piptocephalis tieghemiana]